jgi:SAM-dependent methyltransferase
VLNIKKRMRSSNFQSVHNPEFPGTQQLFDSESGLFRYTNSIVATFYEEMKLKKLVNEDSGKILDFGAGTGFLASLLSNNFGIRPDCVEMDQDLAKLCSIRGFNTFRSLNDTKRDYSVIYTSNVLEHIVDDQKALIEIFNSLIPGGKLAVYVPAHDFLYTKMDEDVGHVRRYARSELKSKVIDAGFKIESLSYADSLGFFATILVKCLGYRRNGNLGSKKSLLVYDKYIFPISKNLDRLGARHIVGKNLILIANKAG